MSDGIANLINADELRFEPAKLRAYYQGREIVLTKTQLNVLQCIHAKHPNFVANEDILNAIWPSNKEPNLPQQHISALNKVLPKYGLHVHSESDIGYQIWQGAHIRKQLSASRVDSKQSSIEVFRDWREADKIISKATKSLFILDSYFGRSGDMEPFIIEALGVRTTRLKISIYMADPQKNFGAQRFKEKERPKGRKMLNKQLLKPYKRVLDSGNVNL